MPHQSTPCRHPGLLQIYRAPRCKHQQAHGVLASGCASIALPSKQRYLYVLPLNKWNRATADICSCLRSYLRAGGAALLSGGRLSEPTCFGTGIIKQELILCQAVSRLLLMCDGRYVTWCKTTPPTMTFIDFLMPSLGGYIAETMNCFIMQSLTVVSCISTRFHLDLAECEQT